MAFGGMQEFVLGLPFLKKHNLIFNQDSKTIGFYTNEEKDDEDEQKGETDKKDKTKDEESLVMKYVIIITVLSILLIGLTLSITLYICKKRMGKIKATELLDDEIKENLNKDNCEENKIINDEETNNNN